jgi:chemotaxis protein methyltransferase CheR
MEEQEAVGTLEITDAEMRSITDALFKRHGVDFMCYEPKSLKRRFTRLLHIYKLKSSAELWMKVLREPGFIHVMINEITVGLTSMFRDPELWKWMARELPARFGAHREIKIWHAGCSTGEELYTMGIVLKETGLLPKAKALATDINSDALATAKKGQYHKVKIVDYATKYQQYKPSGNLASYYTHQDEMHLQMDTALVKHVDFQLHNLVTQPMQKKFDLIFCRNVMIYFDQVTKVKLLKQFHGCLNPGGLLIIGFFDSIVPLIDKGMFNYDDIDLRVFRKV